MIIMNTIKWALFIGLFILCLGLSLMLQPVAIAVAILCLCVTHIKVD